MEHNISQNSANPTYRKTEVQTSNDLKGALLWQTDTLAHEIEILSGQDIFIPNSTPFHQQGFFKKYVHPEDWPQFLEKLNLAFTDDQSVDFTHRMRLESGTTLFAHTQMNRNTDQYSNFKITGITVDITNSIEDQKSRDLKKLESRLDTKHDLQTNEQYYRQLTDSVMDFSVFRITKDGLVESWNTGATRVKGYRTKEILGKHISIFFPEEAKQTIPKLLEGASRIGTAVYEGWLLRKGGIKFWGHLSLSPIENDQGDLIGFTNVAKDITENKVKEENSKRNEERLAQLINSVQDYAFFMLDANGLIMDWNPGAEKLKGYKEKEVIGRSLSLFFEDKTIPEKIIKKAKGDGHAEYEGWIVRKNGQKIWVNVSFSAVINKDGVLAGFSNISRDLTESYRTQKMQEFLAVVGTNLSETSDATQALHELALLAVPGIADSCLIYRVNNIEKLKLVSVAATKDRDAIKNLEATIASAETEGPLWVLKTGRPELFEDLLDYSLHSADQQKVLPRVMEENGFTSSMLVPISAHGEIRGILAFYMRDSGRKFNRQDLENAVKFGRRAAIAIENAELLKSVQNAVQFREDVLAVVSHDLKGPLTSIKLQADILLRKSIQDEAEKRKLTGILKSVSRMNEMISDLLDFASIEKGTLRIQKKVVILSHLLEEITDSLSSTAKDLKIQLEIKNLADPDTRLICDEGRILQVLNNLLGNAFKFSSPESIVIFEIEKGKDHLCFKIIDHGEGIEQTALEHVFDRYWQGKKTDRKSVGLGLSISKALVELHGGKIKVVSKHGEGSTFYFSLPYDINA